MAANETSPILTTSQVITNVTGPPTVTEPGVPHPEAAAELLHEPAGENAGVGIEGEEVVWEARYSMKNFLGRLVTRSALLAGWIALAIYTWGYSDGSLGVLTGIAGLIVAALWVVLIYRMILARYGHYYRLTTRRLFVSTGVWRRRRDMLELLQVRDVFTRQALSERWLSVGTVIVESSDKAQPTFYVTGVQDPKRIMDLIWHHARSERDLRSVKVDKV